MTSYDTPRAVAPDRRSGDSVVTSRAGPDEERDRECLGDQVDEFAWPRSASIAPANNRSARSATDLAWQLF